MPNIGFPELVIILVIVLLLFGPKKLPDFARSMGQAIREFRRASQEVIEDIQHAAEEPKPEPPARSSYDHYEPTPAPKAEEAEAHAGEPSPTKQL